MIDNTTPQHYRHNWTAILIDYVMFGVGINFIGVSTVLPAFVRQFTDSAPIIGMVSTVWNGAWLIPQLAAANALNHLPRKQGALVRMGLLSRVNLLIIALALMLGLWQRPGWMLVGFFALLTLFFGFDAFCSIAWFDIVAKAVPANQRGRLFGAGQIVGGLLAIGIGAFVRWILGPQGLAFPVNYAWLFALAGISVLIGLGALASIREPLEDVPEERASWRDYLPQLIRILREEAAYRHVIAAWLLSGLSALASPFYVLYATDQLGLAPETIGLFIIAQTAGGLVASFGFGALAERRGPGAVISVSVAINASGPLVALALHFARVAGWLPVIFAWVFVVLGIVGSSIMLGFMNYVLELAPPGHRPTYMGLSNTLAGLLVLAPMLGGWLLQSTSYPVLFAAATVGPMLAWVMARRLPVSPQTETSSSA
jgi:MFS family permease